MTTPHWIYLESTGSGKSATAVIPEYSFIATLKNKKSVFITNPKREIFSTTSQMFKDNGYNDFTLDFRNRHNEVRNVSLHGLRHSYCTMQMNDNPNLSPTDIKKNNGAFTIINYIYLYTFR